MPAPTYPAYFTKVGQPLFTAETPRGGFIPDYPLGELRRDALVIRQQFWRLRANYARPAANAQNCSAYPTAYFVDDQSFRDIGMGIVEWTRVWATLPAPWSDVEDFAYTYPAYPATVAPGTGYNVTGLSASGSMLTAYCAGHSGIGVGDTVQLSVTYTRDGLVQSQSFRAKVWAFDAASVTVNYTLPGSGTFSVVSGTIRKVTPGRASPKTQPVPSRLLHEYALATAETLESVLPLVQPFQPLTAAGVETEVLASDSVPTAAAYAAMVGAAQEIVAEPSRRQQYMGNIWVRITRMIPAL